MITVRFEQRAVTVSGHAGYGKKGQDIVCAAMSALVYVQVRLLEKADALTELRAEDGLVRLRLGEGARCEVLELGARWLSTEYPRYVRVVES